MIKIKKLDSYKQNSQELNQNLANLIKNLTWRIQENLETQQVDGIQL